MESLKVGRWFAIVLLLGFVVFDLCGNKTADPLPAAGDVRRAAAAAGAEPVTFDELAGFPLEWGAPDAPFTPPVIPESVRTLDGRRVVVAGFLLPLEQEGERLRKAIVCRHANGCCFGVLPNPHELIETEFAGDGPAPGSPFTARYVSGVLRIRAIAVREDLRDGIYRLEQAAVVE